MNGENAVSSFRTHVHSLPVYHFACIWLTANHKYVIACKLPTSTIANTIFIFLFFPFFHFFLFLKFVLRPSEILVKYTSPNDTQIQNEILRRVSDYCSKPVTNYTLDTYVEPLRWSFYHAFFFSFTVCSTVGKFDVNPMLPRQTKQSHKNTL